MTGLAERCVRAAGRLIPEPYREEVLADLRDEHANLGSLLVAILRSARDVRAQLRASAPLEPRAAGLGSDARSAWRTVRSSPATSLGVIAILAVAIGLNAAVASLVEAVLVRPLRLSEPDRLVFVWNDSARMDKESLAPARALDVRARVSSLQQAALIGHVTMTVTDRGPARRWFGASVSSNFFDVLQSPPAIGRTFRQEDADRDVVVLSHRLFADEFGADPAVVGRRVVMDGRPRTIVGVMTADFYWPAITPETSADQPPLFWSCAPNPDVPERSLVFDEDIVRNRTMGFLRLVARLQPTATVTAAQLELDRLAEDLSREYPGTDGGRGLTLVPAREQFFGQVARPMWFLLLASSLVVVAACANVASLLLVRQATRRLEFAVRSALGASRWRVVRQLMVEAALLAGTGGLFGIALAASGLEVVAAAVPSSVGRVDHVSLDTRVLLWTAGMTALTALLLSAASGFALWRDRSARDLRPAGAAPGRGASLRQTLIGFEAALAMALLVGAGLFGQSVWRLQRIDVGLNLDRLLTFDLVLTGDRAEYQDRQLEFYEGVITRIRALPGVRAASGAFTLPIGGDDFGASALPEGRPFPPPGEDRRVGFQIIWAGWFQTVGMTMIEGRDFLPSDRRASLPAVIINRTLANLEWPGESPIGRRLKYAREDDAPWLTVVGVVSDVRHLGPGTPPRPEIYLPYRQMTQAMMAVAVRTANDPLAIVPAVTQAVAEVDDRQPVSGIGTMLDHLDRAYGRARFLSQLSLVFGVVTMLLTIIGVYGVTSFAVTARTREWGVRAALGASPGHLGRTVLLGSLVPVCGGAFAGAALAWWASQWARSLLFATAPTDPAAYVAAAIVLFLTTTAAALAPARRAAAVDPVTALRG